MKTFLVPSLLALLVVGTSQDAKAGFSIGISIGDHHRHPPVVVARPPVVVVRPPVAHCPPPYVVVPRRCDYGHAHAYVRSCEHHHRAPHWKYDKRRYDSHHHRDTHFRRR